MATEFEKLKYMDEAIDEEIARIDADQQEQAEWGISPDPEEQIRKDAYLYAKKKKDKD